MNPNWRRNLPAIAFVAIFLVADLGMGITVEELVDRPDPTPDARDGAERTWEGGGSRLLFVDDMSGGLARYFEEMDPLPGDEPFDYYGGAVPQVDAGEVFGRWQADRWRHDMWRWGEESLQVTELSGGGEPIPAWGQTDGVEGSDLLHFGDLDGYPGGTFSAVVSPVVDLRGVEPVGRGAEADAAYRLDQPAHGEQGLDGTAVSDDNIASTRDAAYGQVSGTGVADASGNRVGVSIPAAQNASAALRLRHAYGFQVEGDLLRDGGRLEASRLDPVHGWLDWSPLPPSANTLTVGDEELVGRYATPVGGIEVGGGLFQTTGPDGQPATTVGGDVAVAGVTSFDLSPGTGRPWMYQGTIAASTRDLRGQTWTGFGGQSGGLVESVFDLTAHAGHLVRIRFVAASHGDTVNPGLGWALDQMEVHAVGEAGVELLAPVTPTEGALLEPDADAPVVVAVQNTHPDAAEVFLRAGIEGADAVMDRAILPPGPWGRVFHTFPDTLRDLAPDATGLQHLALALTESPDADEGVELLPPAPSVEGRFHFQFGGPTQWRAVRVVTEVVPLGEDDLETDPDGRVVKRGQQMRVHVDLENLGPEPVTLDFSQDPPLEPMLVDTFSDPRGTFEPPGAVMLPPSREASGSLGVADAVRRVTWTWSGIPEATLLNLYVDRIDDDGNRTRVLDGGVVRVETMQPNVLSVDLDNHWDYADAGAETGCRREAARDGRDGVLACVDGAVTSPVEAVHTTDLRRGNDAHLFLVYKGGGSVTLEAHDGDPAGERPDEQAAWYAVDQVEPDASEEWNVASFDLDDLPKGWRGWIRVVVDGAGGDFSVDELRVEVGPEGRRLPLLWHTFTADLSIETTGSLRSVTGGDLAVLDGAVARASDVSEEPVDATSGGVGVEYDDDDVEVQVSILGNIPYSAYLDSKASGASLLQLPGTYVLSGARPTLRFDHWMAPSPSAVGHVDVARVDARLPREVALSAGNLDWMPVATIVASPLAAGTALEPVAVPLWDHAGQEVLLRFRYQVDQALQPNALSEGWVLDAITVDHVLLAEVEELHRATGDYAADGYAALGVRFEEEVKGAPKAPARLVETVLIGAHQADVDKNAYRFGLTQVDISEMEKYSVCADLNEPTTYQKSQSIITPALDLRALDRPILVLEHGGRWTVGRPFGRALFDIEYQTLGADGTWESWQRATPYDENFQPLHPYLKSATDGGFVHDPFAAQNWGKPDSHGGGFAHMELVDLVGEDATRFSLASPGPAGEIARFRFLHWEEHTPGTKCWDDNDFDWYVYSMKVYEDTHLFDAEPTSITFSRDDRSLLDRTGASGDLDPDAAVVAGDTVTVDVQLHNNGTLSHIANATMDLLRADGTPVPDAVRFLDRSGEGPGRLTERNHGNTPLQPDEEKAVGFRVEFGLVPPGDYTLRTVVDLDDALDTNPRNDVLSRQVRVAPVRALEVGASARVFPVAGVPDEARLLTLEVRNHGNVRDSAEVHAKVVELLGVGRERDIGPLGEDGEPTPYVLKSQPADDLAARTGKAALQWDLVADVPASNTLDLKDLLRPGSRYAVNVTLAPRPTVDAWWTDGAVPDDVDLHDLTDPGTRCGCAHVPFLVEDLLAASDLTESEAVLDGYLDGGLDAWDPRTSVRVDGEWQDASDRSDLPQWEVLDRNAAGNLTGTLGQGDAWHLAPYEGFEAVEHTLTSPPLPGHVIDSQSQAILDLRYARAEDDGGDVRVEVRTLEAGGRWSEWGPVDGLRAQRVAVVLPPDYPQVLSTRMVDPPIPPFYSDEWTLAKDMESQTWSWDGDVFGLIPSVSQLDEECNSGYDFSDPSTEPKCRWSPFPLFPRPGEAGHDQSLQTLATVLRTLADEVGPENVGVFTTFPEDQDDDCFKEGLDADGRGECFGEFGVPTDGLDAHGVAFATQGIPRLRVKSADHPITPPHELPVLGLEELGRGLGTYGALLVMGDGLARYAGGREEGHPHQSKVLADLAEVYTDEDLEGSGKNILTNADLDAAGLKVGITVPAGPEVTTPELDRHFEELLQVLRFAPSAGVRVVGGLGPAPASIGLSGVAEDVPLALWIPDRTPGRTGDIPLPVSHSCMVESPDGSAFMAGVEEGGLDYVFNITNQPKQKCWKSGGELNPLLIFGNFIYASGLDAQASALRELLERGNAEFSHVATLCNPGTTSIFSCIRPQTSPISHQKDNVHFITASQETQAQAWVDRVLATLDADGALPPGDGAWQDLPVEMATPVGGTFRPGPDGAPRFVGETMQFRVVVRSDPTEQGHGRFLLDSFRLLGTPPAEPDVEVRVAQPVHGALRQPGERGFHVTAEVINRGLEATEAAEVRVGMAQVPGDGDCGGTCIVHAFHPASGGPEQRILDIPPLPPGGRYVVTLGSQPLQPDLGAPSGILYDASCTPSSCEAGPFNDGVFPRVPQGAPEDPELWFEVRTDVVSGPPTEHDGFTALNDAHAAVVVGTDVVKPLVKDPQRDVRVRPNQVALEGSGGSGTSPADPVPVRDSVDVRVRLTNDGSRPLQVGRVDVEVHPALPNDCLDKGAGKYSACLPDGSPLPDALWEGTLGSLEVPRGTTVEDILPIDLEDAGLPPAVYRVEVHVETAGRPSPQSFQRWLYLVDPADGPWAYVREDLSSIKDNGDLVGADSGTWSTPFTTGCPNACSPPSNGEGGSPFYMDPTTPCRRDNATREGTTSSGTPMEHGWRLSDGEGDACQSFQDAGSHAMHWLRNATPAWDHEQSNWVVANGDSGDPRTAAQSRGVADFGPDAIIWHPGHDRATTGSGVVNSVVDSLARFEPGTAALVLDTRFQATPNTAYVVEMQVPVRSCRFSGVTGASCSWNWDWGSDDSQHWFPLQAVGGVTPDHPALTTADRTLVAGCRAVSTNPLNPNPPTICDRNGPTNPLGGLPGIWGASSTDFFGVDDDGWLRVRYPVDPAVQDHVVRDSDGMFLYQGIDGYCNRLLFNGDARETQDGLRNCMYSWSQGGINGPTDVKEEIPRPVAFRLRAASYAGDEGANRWQVRDLSLTAHDLRLDGAQRFEVPFVDGETKAVPVEVRNAGPVDDVVAVTAKPSFPLGGLDVGVAEHSLGEPQDRLLLRIPAGETRTAWVSIHFDYGAGGLTPEVEHEIPIDVTAASAVAPSTKVEAVVDALLRPLHRADLVVGAMVVDGNSAGDVDAAEGVPVHTTLLVRNEGSRPVDGEPVLVRLLAREVDPDDRSKVLGVEPVAQTVVTETFGSHCFRERCSVPVNLQWTPDVQGVFELLAEVNLPRLGDGVPQVPEGEFGNNAPSARLVNVGAVPLADLQILDVRVVPFDAGCAPVGEAVERLVAGHSYCLAARVTNAGSRAAVDPVAEFSIGASAPFSRGQGDGLPNPLDASDTAWVFSSPVRAALPRVGDLMEFQVQLDTRSTTASVEAKDRVLLVPVDDYDLELFTGDVSDLPLERGGQATLSLRVRNSGTAVATPVVRAAEADGLRVHLARASPLQPGEEGDVELVLRAGLSAREGPHDLEVSFSTAEDRLVHVPLALRPTVGEDAPAAVSAIPLRAAPGDAVLDVVLDNSAWAREGVWVPVETTGPIGLRSEAPLQADGHDVALHGIPVTVLPHTPPGEHAGVVRFQATHGIVSDLVEAPYVLHVEPEPGLTAGLADRDVVTLQGVDARLSLHLENTGNVPVEASLRHAVDSGFLAAAWQNLTLAPGDNRSVPIVVEAGAASRSLGESLVRWREVGGDWNDGETVLWSVRHVPGSVRISSTDLADVTLRPDEVQTVRAFLQNPGREPVEAEAVLVVDGVLQSRQRVLLPADAVQPVDLPLRVATGDHVIQVVARPAGADVGLSDPVFHDVGDVRVREVDVGDRGGGLLSDLAIPGPGVLVGLLALLGAALVWRRRR